MASLFSDATHQELAEILKRYPERCAAVLPVLHAVQRELGYIPAEAEEEVAELLGMAPVKVHEVLTFYHMLHAHPVGKYHLQFCRTLPCALRGASKLIDKTREKLGVGEHEVTADKRFSYETVECLAACGNAPAVQVNDEYHFDIDEESLVKLLEELD